ncbi:MAG: hypothetical protein M3O26_15650 [Pseudomonadota bacterium]|nr:hypothetical protein [Pseudomonadota bacterium]
MTEITDWDALRQLRMAGKKPTLPVIVTTKPQLPQRLDGVGCLVILHKAGEVMPIKLLDGLDVIFWFDRCELELHVKHMADAKGVTFERSRVWCNCAGLLSILPMSCDSMASAIEWMETGYVAA